MEEIIQPKEIKTRPLANVIIDTWNTRINEKIIELYSLPYEGEDLSGNKKRSGLEGVKNWLDSVLRAFPNIHYTLVDYVESGDRLVLHWLAKGNHHGSFLKIPASGKQVALHGISFLKLEGGKIRRANYFGTWQVYSGKLVCYPAFRDAIKCE